MKLSLNPQRNLIVRIYELLDRPGILGDDGRKYLRITWLPLQQFGADEARQLVGSLLQEQRSSHTSDRATFLDTCRLVLDKHPIADFATGRIEQWFDWPALADLAEHGVICKRCHAALLALQPSIEAFESDGVWPGDDPLGDCLEVLDPLSRCKTCGSHFALEISLEKAGLIQRYLFYALPSPLKRVSGLVWRSPETMQEAFEDYASFLEEIAAAAHQPIVLFFYEPIAPYEGVYFKVLPLTGQAQTETELTRQLSALTGEVLRDYKELRNLHKSERRSAMGERRLDLPPGLLLRQREGLVATLLHPVLSSGPWRSLLLYTLWAWLAESTTRQDNVIRFDLPWVDEAGDGLVLEFTLTDVRRRGTTIFGEDIEWGRVICLFVADVHRSVGSESLRERWRWALKAQPRSAFSASGFINSLQSTRKAFLEFEKKPLELATPGAPLDLVMQVSADPDSSNRIEFCLDYAPLNYFQKKLGNISLIRDEQAAVVADMDQLARQSRTRFLGDDPTEPNVRRPTVGLLASRGRALWTDLIPPELQEVYAKSLREHRGQTLLLVSNNASFPWELIKPNGLIDTPEGPVAFEDDWMARQFEFARWLLAHRPPAATIGLQRICCVAATSNIAGALEEVQRLKNLAEAHGGRCDLPASKEQLLGMLSTNQYDIVHFACHGKFLVQDPGESTIQLPDGITLSPDDLTDPGIRRAFSQSRPLIFLNSCHSGRTGSTLIGVGGWAKRFIDQECGAFLGCGWEVQSHLACDFAITFYNRLQDNATLGEAVRVARESIKSDDNSTWLAYCLYGDPRCRPGN